VRIRDWPLVVIIFLLFIETLCCTYFLDLKQQMVIVSIAYIASGLGLGVFPLLFLGTRGVDAGKINNNYLKINKLILWTFLAFSLVFTVYHAHQIMLSMAIDYRTSDTLPQVKALSQRLLAGEKIYAPVQEIWNGKQPPYLPMMWLPYVPAEYFGFDVRWISTVFILAGLFLTFRLIPAKFSANPLLLAAACTSLFLLLNYLLVREKITLGWTEEGVVIGYYLFLGFALARNNPILVGIGIACCLLSRFSLFFWAPMFMAYVFFFDSKKNALIQFSVTTIIILLVFFIPFFIKQPEYFLNIPSDYHVGVDRAWKFNLIEGVYYPYSLGVSKFFDISHIKMLHNMSILISALVPLLVGLLFTHFRSKLTLNHALFGLCSLKISLVFFYNLIEVPYYYLFLTSTFFSYPLVFKYISLYFNRVEFPLQRLPDPHRR
jgi:hypothetical protein